MMVFQEKRAAGFQIHSECRAMRKTAGLSHKAKAEDKEKA